MMKLAKMVEIDIDGRQLDCSIAVVNDIDVEKSTFGDYYFFQNKETLKKYNTVFNQNWQEGYIEIHFLSEDDYWNEKIKLDKQMVEIQKRIDQLEVCHRTVRIDENERNGYTPKNGVFHFNECCYTCKYIIRNSSIMQGLDSPIELCKCSKTGKLINGQSRQRCYEPKNVEVDFEKAKNMMIQLLKQYKND